MVTVATFTSLINQLLPEPHAGLLAGILFGTKATLSKELVAALTTTGTLHIVALSGMNITILSSLVNMTLLRFINRRVASILTIALIIGFILFVGPSPSVIRAGIMGGISLLAIVFGRQTLGLLSWMLAVSTMILLNPSWITDLSFQLSALATLGMILFGGRNDGGKEKTFKKGAGESILKSTEIPPRSPFFFREAGGGISLSEGNGLFQIVEGDCRTSLKNTFPTRLFRSSMTFYWHIIEDNLRLTLSAQVFTIPLIFLHFHRISIISPITNVLIGWVLPPLTVLGLLTAIGGWIFLPLGHVVAWPAWALLQYVIVIVEWTGRVPGASIGW